MGRHRRRIAPIRSARASRRDLLRAASHRGRCGATTRREAFRSLLGPIGSEARDTQCTRTRGFVPYDSHCLASQDAVCETWSRLLLVYAWREPNGAKLPRLTPRTRPERHEFKHPETTADYAETFRGRWDRAHAARRMRTHRSG